MPCQGRVLAAGGEPAGEALCAAGGGCLRCWPAVVACVARPLLRGGLAGGVGPRPLRGPGRVLRGGGPGGVLCRRGLRRGRGRGSFAAGASAGAEAAGVAAGFSRGQGPGLGSALLAVVRFRGAARGPLRSAGRGALSCMGRAAGVPVVPMVRPAGGKQQSYKYSKKSMSRKHQSQHPLTTTRNFTSFFTEKATGVASKE